MPAIEVEGLAKRFPGGLRRPGKHALRGVDLRVPQGVAFGLIGPNGAGKTTLLKILLGLTRPTAGRVRLLGHAPDRVEARRRVGYLPERLHLQPSWTPVQVLRSVARLKGLGHSGAEVHALLDRVGLTEVAEAKVGPFSKGMKQRLGLATALVGAPDLLVLDEPTDGIDPKGRMDIRRILELERQRGATIFLNSHLLAETERVCEQVGFLVAGRLVEQGAMVDLCGAADAWVVHFEARSGDQRALLDGMAFVPLPEPGAYRLRADSLEALNRHLDAARDQGWLLKALRPEMRDLEDVLLALMERSSREPAR